jgi:hypothetical protein
MGRACYKLGGRNGLPSVGKAVGKPEEKRPLGRTNRKWEDNIKMDLREIGWVSMD